LSKNYLDYVFIVIGADRGITNNTKTLLKIALTMNLPIITIITKIDMINEDDIHDIIDNFKCIYKSEKIAKNILVTKDITDIVTFSRTLKENILPVFLVKFYITQRSRIKQVGD
jgi:GTPase